MRWNKLICWLLVPCALAGAYALLRSQGFLSPHARRRDAAAHISADARGDRGQSTSPRSKGAPAEGTKASGPGLTDAGPTPSAAGDGSTYNLSNEERATLDRLLEETLTAHVTSLIDDVVQQRHLKKGAELCLRAMLLTWFLVHDASWFAEVQRRLLDPSLSSDSARDLIAIVGNVDSAEARSALLAWLEAPQLARMHPDILHALYLLPESDRDAMEREYAQYLHGPSAPWGVPQFYGPSTNSDVLRATLAHLSPLESLETRVMAAGLLPSAAEYPAAVEQTDPSVRTAIRDELLRTVRTSGDWHLTYCCLGALAGTRSPEVAQVMWDSLSRTDLCDENRLTLGKYVAMEACTYPEMQRVLDALARQGDGLIRQGMMKGLDPGTCHPHEEREALARAIESIAVTDAGRALRGDAVQKLAALRPESDAHIDWAYHDSDRSVRMTAQENFGHR